MKRKALRCARATCNKPIRKGADVVLTEFCVYDGRNADGAVLMRPWFVGPIVLHSRCAPGGITADELRRLKAQG